MVAFCLDPIARGANHHLLALDSVDSTNVVAMQKASTGAQDNLWVVTDEQTAGKGRRGRVWQTSQGNLATSIFINIPRATKNPELLGFVAAIAVAKTVRDVLGNDASKIALKWPNDVLVNDAKVAGILLEAKSLPRDNLAIIVGMGVNIVSLPKDVPYKTIALNQIAPQMSAATLFTELTKNWVETFAIWNYDQGRQQILDQWRGLACGLGSKILVTRVNDYVEGKFAAIDDQGRLVVELKNGQNEIISVGNVQF